VTFKLNGSKAKGLVGPNGSGKSTLMNVITGVPYRSDGGTITLDGRNIEKLRPQQICRLGIARTFQTITFFPSLTVEQNVLVGSSSVGASHEVVHDALGITGLSEKKAVMAKNLAVVDLKKLMIAAGLGVDPKILLLDEPLGGLSEEETSNTLEVIKSINETGRALLVVEHKLGKLMDLCDELLVLHLGNVIGDGEPMKVINTEEVLTAYLGGERYAGS
jgi:branched-chain amino acid transport system ATP-binding protein